MNQQKLEVKVASRRDSDGETFWEGTVSMQGLKNTKLVKTDESTKFSSASSVRSAAQRLADRLNVSVSFGDEVVKKAAAKKTPTKTARKSGSATTSRRGRKPAAPSTSSECCGECCGGGGSSDCSSNS